MENYFENITFPVKNTVATFGQLLGKIGLLFIPTSGHTVSQHGQMLNLKLQKVIFGGKSQVKSFKSFGGKTRSDVHQRRSKTLETFCFTLQMNTKIK